MKQKILKVIRYYESHILFQRCLQLQMPALKKIKDKAGVLAQWLRALVPLQYLRKMEVDIPQEPAMPRFVIYLKDLTFNYRDTCSFMFIADLFIRARN